MVDNATQESIPFSILPCEVPERLILIVHLREQHGIEIMIKDYLFRTATSAQVDKWGIANLNVSGLSTGLYHLQIISADTTVSHIIHLQNSSVTIIPTS